MNKSFTLVEVLIVVAILGILAAVVLPQFQSHTQQAREAAAKDNLRILRNAIELYAVRHNGIPPGYSILPGSTIPSSVSASIFGKQLVHLNGGYISKMPVNPFNNLDSIIVIPDGDNFPAAPIGAYGWIYKPQTKEIRLDWPGTDSAGTSYFDY
jgi:prepilin-type N-terminal cleavage/methylation domain-containing protein